MPCDINPMGCSARQPCMPCWPPGSGGPRGPRGPAGPAGPIGPAGPAGASEFLIPFADGENVILDTGSGPYMLSAVGFGNAQLGLGEPLDPELLRSLRNMAFAIPQDMQIMSLDAFFTNIEPIAGDGELTIHAELFVAYHLGDTFEPFFGVTLSPSYHGGDPVGRFARGSAAGPSATVPGGARLLMCVYATGTSDELIVGHVSAGVMMRTMPAASYASL